MRTADVENELRNLKLTHLTESELVAYCDQKLDEMWRSRADTHLQRCFICERRLALLREEKAALSNWPITADDPAHVDWVMKQRFRSDESSTILPADPTKRILLQERLADYLRQMVANWQIAFSMPAVRAVAHPRKEVWQWISEDGKLRARMNLESDASLIIYLSSSELDLEGTRLNVRIGPFKQEVNLLRISDEEIQSRVVIPRRQRARNLADIAIEIL